MTAPDGNQFSVGRSQMVQSVTAQNAAASEPRNAALDGFRGLMTAFVLVSHYLAEVPHGQPVFMVGWIAVTSFFVLSGFLVGRLIIEKQDRANFFTVFYIRRFCRTLPVYFVCVTLVFGCLTWYAAAPWISAHKAFPLWSYLVFVQNFFFVAANSTGQHWLTPTWTLAIEEQFYLFVPALFFIVPRRHLPAVLIAGVALTVGFRAFVVYSGTMPQMARLVLLPGVADMLFCGLIAAVLWKTEGIDWPRHDQTLRIAPLVLLLVCGLLRMLDGETGKSFEILGPLALSAAAAAFILSLVRGAPEAKRFASPVLCFLGNTSYSIYLTHLSVVGLVHGLVLGRAADIGTPAQLALTLASIPLAVLLGWVLTKLVEQPITAYGRSWAWSKSRRPQRLPVITAPGAALPA